jgi:hypothetical protein
MREFVDEFMPTATSLYSTVGHVQCHCEFPRLARLYTQPMRAEASAGVGLKPSDLLKPLRPPLQRATSGHLIQNIQAATAGLPKYVNPRTGAW